MSNQENSPMKTVSALMTTIIVAVFIWVGATVSAHDKMIVENQIRIEQLNRDLTSSLATQKSMSQKLDVLLERTSRIAVIQEQQQERRR